MKEPNLVIAAVLFICASYVALKFHVIWVGLLLLGIGLIVLIADIINIRGGSQTLDQSNKPHDEDILKSEDPKDSLH